MPHHEIGNRTFNPGLLVFIELGILLELPDEDSIKSIVKCLDHEPGIDTGRQQEHADEDSGQGSKTESTGYHYGKYTPRVRGADHHP
jgi:hypothetical protein